MHEWERTVEIRLQYWKISYKTTNQVDFLGLSSLLERKTIFDISFYKLMVIYRAVKNIQALPISQSYVF